MKDIELNLEKIKSQALICKDKNYEFRTFLKNIDSDHVDRIVQKIYKGISDRINCQECGNCCMSLRPMVTNNEIKVLAELEKITCKEFLLKYIDTDSDEKYLKDKHCRYLSGKSCSIYSCRPKVCKDFPNVHKKEFNSRTLAMIDNYEICPIVYNVYENLKKEFGYRK